MRLELFRDVKSMDLDALREKYREVEQQAAETLRRCVAELRERVQFERVQFDGDEIEKPELIAPSHAMRLQKVIHAGTDYLLLEDVETKEHEVLSIGAVKKLYWLNHLDIRAIRDRSARGFSGRREVPLPRFEELSPRMREQIEQMRSRRGR